MATVTVRNAGADRQRVRHSLERLRGYIRSYVALEGLLFVGLFAALWFWIGLALDYGPFRLFAFDWVQELGWGVRLGLFLAVLGLLLVLLAGRVAARLLHEF